MQSDVDLQDGGMNDVDLQDDDMKYVGDLQGDGMNDIDLQDSGINDVDLQDGGMKSDVNCQYGGMNDVDLQDGETKSDVDLQDGVTNVDLKDGEIKSDVGILKSLYTSLYQKSNNTMSVCQFHRILQQTLIPHQSMHEDILGGNNSASEQTRLDGLERDHVEEVPKSIPTLSNSKNSSELECCSEKMWNVSRRLACDSDIKPCRNEEGKINEVRLRESGPDLLLMLTCVTALFEGEHDLKLLLAHLHSSHILHVLLDLVYCEEHFTSFAATTSLIAGLKCRHNPDMEESVLRRIIGGATQTVSHATQFSSLGLLKRFMSNGEGRVINDWCFTATKSSPMFTGVFAKMLMTARHPTDSSDIPLAYLTLVQKTVKFINKMDKETRHENLKSMFRPIQCVLVNSLATALEEVDVAGNRIQCRKMLDVFNTLFNYGSLLSQDRRVPQPYVHVAQQLLSSISPSVLASIPFQHVFVGFGGSVVEGPPTQQLGDLPLLKKLMLVLVKSSAIVLKSDNASLQDEMLTISTMAGIRDFMKDVFPGNVSSIQWLPLVFGDQDDAWIEMLLSLLDCHLNIQRVTEALPELWDPHLVFLQFLNASSRDHMIIVDLLTSPETCFLLYFLRYLKCVVCQWDAFIAACHHCYHSYCVSSRQIQQLTVASHDNRTASTHGTEIVKKIKLSNACQNGVSIKGTFQYTSSLAALAVYSDSESSDDDLVMSEHTSTAISRPPLLTNNTASDAPSIPHVKHPNSTATMENLDSHTAAMHDDVLSRCNPGNIHDSESSLYQHSKHRHMPSRSSRGRLKLQGSAMSCDHQCVEQVLSVLIRVGLRIEGLSDQDLFPYNPGPLLSILGQIEGLYEQMGAECHV